LLIDSAFVRFTVRMIDIPGPAERDRSEWINFLCTLTCVCDRKRFDGRSASRTVGMERDRSYRCGEMMLFARLTI
jgi:hypothetical protein